jgi:flagellar basal body-associated protein FliL
VTTIVRAVERVDRNKKSKRNKKSFPYLDSLVDLHDNFVSAGNKESFCAIRIMLMWASEMRKRTVKPSIKNPFEDISDTKMFSTYQLNNNAMKNKMKVTESRLRDLILKQVQSRYFDKIQELSSRLDLADFENKRLRERFSTLKKQVALLKEGVHEGSQADVSKSITGRKHVGIQVELGFNSEKDEIKMDLEEHIMTSTLNSSVYHSEVGSLISSKGKEQATHEC